MFALDFLLAPLYQVAPMVLALVGRKLLFTLSLPRGIRIEYSLLDRGTIENVFIRREYNGFCRIDPGWVIVDLGAHIGTCSVPFAKTVGPTGLVVAVEPDPVNFARLIGNIRLNGLTNVVTVRAAVSSSSGVTQLFLDRRSTDGHSIEPGIVNQGGSAKSIQVLCMTMDEVFRTLELRRIDLLKIDVEGVEIDVLKGGTAALQDTKRILMEVHVRRASLRLVAQTLLKLGFERYDARRIDASSFVVYAQRTPKLPEAPGGSP